MLCLSFSSLFPPWDWAYVTFLLTQGVKGNGGNILVLSVQRSHWSEQRCVSSHIVWTTPCLKMPSTFIRCLLNTVTVTVWFISYRSATYSSGAELSFFPLLPLSPSLYFFLSLLPIAGFRGRYTKTNLPRLGTRISLISVLNAYIVSKAQHKTVFVRKKNPNQTNKKGGNTNIPPPQKK